VIATKRAALSSQEFIRMHRREISILLAGIAAGVAITAFAQQQSKSQALTSAVYTWGSLPVEKTTSGERRAVFDSYTATLDRLETHVTTVNVGMASHSAHRHPDEELVYVREGVVEATINGMSHRANAGSVIFFASNDLHGMRNVGETPASYFVLRWTSPGREGPRPGGSR
jgi:XRE family transcriptional regulator, regulator of sulfur utilization